jgi:FMN reductase
MFEGMRERAVSQSSGAQGFSPLIVGIGGTTRAGSTSEKTLAKALAAAERLGARTLLFGGDFLSKLPIYDPKDAESGAELLELLDAVRSADGVLIATPGYHGSVSGVIKNALDSLEGLRGDERPYFEGRAVGCIVTADGWQACGTTLAALRTIVHALRGWPTPLGITFNPSAGALFDQAGELCEERNALQIEMIAAQVVEFARMRAAVAAS